MKRFSAPGKVFLLGEYAVLGGAPAWLVAIGPRFELAVDRGSTPSRPFAPASPAGRLCAAIASPDEVWTWRDPHEGRGGFGASSAQFLLAYYALSPQPSVTGALERHHALHATEAMPPSGADIAAQAIGGAVRYVVGQTAESVRVELDFSRTLLFSATALAGRKINTHEHLARLGRRFFDEYRAPLAAMTEILEYADRAHAACGALRTEAAADLMNRYAETLCRAGLEAPAATADREALRALPQVAAVKGTGAGLADALWVILEPHATAESIDTIIRVATGRGLQPVPLQTWDGGVREETI